MDVIQNLIAGPLPGDDDLAMAVALASLVHSELEEFGTAAQNQRQTATRSRQRSVHYERPWLATEST